MNLSLVANSFIVCSAQQWPIIINYLQGLVSAVDLWGPEDITQPLTIAYIRQLHQFASQTPQGLRKIAYLPLVDQWKPETGNALLKLLEEPPAFLTLVLLSETTHILPTLSSRLQRISLSDNSATINMSAPFFKLEEEGQREKAQTWLYLQPLLHSGIKKETVDKLFV